MMRWSGLGILMLVSFLFVSCEKTVSVIPDTQVQKLVVDAQIETGQPPIVLLSKSLSFFTSIDTSALYASFIKDATVTITDGVRTHRLRFYDQRDPSTGQRLLFYSNDLTSPSTALTGTPGRSYSMTIAWQGQQYTAVTTIPRPLKTVDSLWWMPVPNRPATDTLAVLMGKFTDPPGLGNYIRYFTRVNRQSFYPGFNSVFDDQIVDGKIYSIAVDRGVDKNFPIEPDTYGYFKKGDTVTLKLCNIDKASFDFWRTWEFSYQSNGNPFSSPGVVIGNISNGALGSFCGYSTQFRTLIIPK